MTGRTSVALNDLATLVRGITFKPAERVLVGSPGSVVCFRTANIQENLDQSDLIAVPAAKVQRRDQLVQPGDVLISSANSWNLVGKCVAVPELAYPAAAGGFISILRPKTGTVDTRYLYRWLSDRKTQHVVRGLARQTTNIANLPADRLLEMSVPLPTPAEQRRIAAMLDKADEIRRKRRESLRLLDEFLVSAFLEMFGDPVNNDRKWEVVKLRDCFAIRPSIGTITPAVASGELKVVRVGELGGYDVALEDCGRVSLSAKEVVRYEVVPGDLLVARAIGSASHLGKASVLQEVREPVVFDSHVMRLRLDPKRILPAFLWQWFHTPGGRRLFLRQGGRTAVQFNINASQLCDARIPLPPITEQERFLRVATKARATRKQIAGGMTTTGSLFDLLSQRAFRGQSS